MILVDANLLLYAVDAGLPQHAAAHAWLDAQLNGPGPVGLPWESLTAFLRIATNPRIFPRALSGAQAWARVEVPTPTASSPRRACSRARIGWAAGA